jgi:hypothetical protein
MSHQRYSTSQVSFLTQNTFQTSQTRRDEAQGEPLRTPRAHGMPRPPTSSIYTFATESAPRHYPRTHPRVGTASSTTTSPNIDAIRALYRKHSSRFPKTPPQIGIMPSNAPRAAVPRYRNTVPNTSLGSPTPDRPRSRPRTISHSERTPLRSAIPTSFTLDPKCKRPAGGAVDAPEPTLMYSDFGPGFAPAGDPAPNLALDIVLRPQDMEKWELPQRE